MTRPLENGMVTRNLKPIRPSKLRDCDECEEAILEGDMIYEFQDNKWCSPDCGHKWFDKQLDSYEAHVREW